MDKRIEHDLSLGEIFESFLLKDFKSEECPNSPSGFHSYVQINHKYHKCKFCQKVSNEDY